MGWQKSLGLVGDVRSLNREEHTDRYNSIDKF